jgi:hypothetical protein
VADRFVQIIAGFHFLRRGRDTRREADIEAISLRSNGFIVAMPYAAYGRRLRVKVNRKSGGCLTGYCA